MFGWNKKEGMSDAMVGRKLGHFPISIATSLALEVTLGTGTAPEENPTKDNVLKNYESIWINLRTLARNAINAVDTSMKDQLAVQDIVEVLKYETQQIDAIIDQYIPGCREVIFYESSYKDLVKRIGTKVILRSPRTEIQKRNASLINLGTTTFAEASEKEMQQLRKSDPLFENKGDGVRRFKWVPDPDKAVWSTAILTHFPLDLVHHTKFKKLTLLESHTGALKTYDQWDSKFYDKDAKPMPFNAASLAFFGDTEVFKPVKPEVRQQIIAIARKRGWSGVTTNSRFLQGLELGKNPYLLQVAKDLIREI